MSTNYHTPIATSAAGTSAIVNSPLSEIDIALTNTAGIFGKTAKNISSTETLTDSSTRIQALDPQVATQFVDLPAEASTNPFFIIINTSGAFVIIVRDDATSTIDTLAPGESTLVFSTGVVWRKLR